MRIRSLCVAAATGVLLAGCSAAPPPVVVQPSEAPTTEPAYDPTLEPSAAVLAVVPGDADVLDVTDYDEVRLALGYGEMTSASDRAERTAFWRQADEESALLSPGMLRDQGYDQRFGFTQDDVSWEAHFDGPAGEGYVVKFRDDLDMGGVQEAAAAPDGPLAGATVVASEGIAAVGATAEPTQSWAADPELVALVGQAAGATYVSRECLSLEEAFGSDIGDDLAPTPAEDLDALETLGPFSVAFGAELVTVRLGGGSRGDVFERARLAETLPATVPEFGLGYADPVGDPLGGRIGYQLQDGPVAARLATERQLPFAVCG